jgi:uncharacterized protein (TIGR00369 family)
MTDIETTLRALLMGGAFHQFLGMELVGHDATAGLVEIRLPWRAEFERGPGSRQWHGGPIAALIDITADFALIAQVGRGLPTIDLRVDYLRPAIDTGLTATGRVVRNGRTVGWADVEVRDDQGRLVAIGRGVYATLPPKDGA